MAKGLVRWPLLVVAGLILLLAGCTGCGLTPEHTDRASQRWSNGKPLDIAILNSPLALQVDEMGHSFVVWVGPEHRLYLAHLDGRAGLVAQQPLDLELDSPLRPQLVLDTRGHLHLTWLDGGEGGFQLFYAFLSTEGQVFQGPVAMSPPGQPVSRHSMALDPVGQTVEVFWSDDAYGRPGCYHAAVDWSGAVVVPAHLLVADGVWPSAQTDRLGFVHLAWRTHQQVADVVFRYAVYDPQRRTLGPDTMAAEPLVQASMFGGPVANAEVEGPWLGLDKDTVYLAWMLEARQRNQLSTFTFYRAFSQPDLERPEDAAAFDYALPETALDAVLVRGSDPSLTGHPRFLEGQPEQQVLVYYTQVSGPGNMMTMQIASADVHLDQIDEQDVVNATRSASLRPSVAADGQGNLYVAWIDTAGFSRYQVLYASTSERVKAVLNRITTYDVVDRVLTAAMSALSALFFIPIALGWMLLPILLLVVSAWVTKESLVSDSRGPIALGMAIAVHWACKVLLFPAMLSRGPFASLSSPLWGMLLGRWLFPLLLAVLSAGAVWLYLRRRRHQTLFVAYLMFAAIDSVLTLIIYVSPLWG
jgi:hypothetical protein